jgi:hypothetical protein
MEELKIRPLERRDRKTLTTILEKFVKTNDGKGICHYIVSEYSEKKEQQSQESNEMRILKVAAEIIGQLIQVLNDDISLWFSDLIGKSPEEFDHLEFDIETKILNQIVEAEGFAGFFTGALRASNRIREFLNQQRK